jgi:hypothetical protein
MERDSGRVQRAVGNNGTGKVKQQGLEINTECGAAEAVLLERTSQE